MSSGRRSGAPSFRALRRDLAGGLLGIAIFAPPAPAMAEPVSDFYANRTITISVGLGPGGGYDAYARLLSRHFAKHMPGPTLRHMTCVWGEP